jgi:G3E family GTPase
VIPIVLVTGFLGCGKTTLLKRFVDAHRSRRFLYLVNEFSPQDVDGVLMQSEGVEVVAIPGGSLFCNCLVTDFIRTLTGIAKQFPDLEAVIIEASGMANPKVIEQMLVDTKLDGDYRLSQIISVIDPVSFRKLKAMLPNLSAQIEAADTVLINKEDLASESEMDECRRAVILLNPQADIQVANHCAVDLDLLPVRQARGLTGDYALCRDPNYETFTTEAPLEDTTLEQILGRFSDSIYRIKGQAVLSRSLQRVEYASGQLETTPGSPEAPYGLVWIVRGGVGEEIRQALDPDPER